MNENNGRTVEKEEIVVQNEVNTHDPHSHYSEDEKMRILLEIANRQRMQRPSSRLKNTIMALIALILFATLTFGIILMFADRRHTVTFMVNSEIIRQFKINDGEVLDNSFIPEFDKGEFVHLDFDGYWYTNVQGLGEPYAFSMPVYKDITLYAGVSPKQVTLNVHLNDNSGLAYQIKGGSQSVVPLYNAEYLEERVADEYKNNYILLGFATSSTATTPEYPVNHHLPLFAGDLYAVWQGVEVNIVIKAPDAKELGTDDDFVEEQLNINYGNKLTVNTSDFANVYQEGTGARVLGIRVTVGEKTTVYTDGEEITVTNDMQLELAFIDEVHRAIVDLNNGEPVLEYYGYGRQVKLADNINNPHYKLVEYSNSKGEPKSAGAIITIENDAIYTAVWAGEVYTILLDSGDADFAGTARFYQKYNEGFYSNESATTQISKIQIPTKAGYIFQGYFVEQEIDGELLEDIAIDENGDFNPEMPFTTFTENTTLLARFVLDSVSITVEENEYGEIIPVSDTTIDYGGVFEFRIKLGDEYQSKYQDILTLLKQKYFTLEISQSETTPGDINENTIFEITNLTANFSLSLPSLEVDKYTVTWKNYDGTILQQENYEINENDHIHPEQPTRTSSSQISYEFLDWNLEVDELGNHTYTAKFRGKVSVPSVADELTYNGQPQSPDIEASEYYLISGNVQTDAGSYTAIITLLESEDDLVWDDGSTLDKSLEWTIAKAKLNKPTASKTQYEYNDSMQTLLLVDFIEEAMTITGNTAIQSNADGENYTAIISISDTINYEWEDGGNEDHEILWTITKVTLNKPTANKTSYEYNGSMQTLLLSGFNASLMTIEDNTAKDAGDYVAVIKLNDKNNYKWQEYDASETEDCEIAWTITKAILTVTVVDTSIVSGSELPASFEVNFSGFKGGDDESVLSAPFVLSTTAEDSETQGTFDILIDMDNLPTATNYEFSFTNGGKGTLTITAAGNVAIPSLDTNTFTYTGYNIKPNITNFNSEHMEIVADSTESAKDANIYSITISLIGGYSWIGGVTDDITLNWTINPAPLSIQIAEIVTITYGDNLPDITYSVDLLGEDTIESVFENIRVEMSAEQDSHAGTYTFEVVYDEILSLNYTVVDNPTGTLIINARVFTKPTVAGSSTFTYNGSEQTLQFSGIYSGMIVTGEKATNTGSYTATVSLDNPQHKVNYTWSDGGTETLSFNWTIQVQALVVPIVTSEFTYNGEVQSPSITPSAHYTIGGTTTATNAGTYNAVISLKDTANYIWEGAEAGKETEDIILNWTIEKLAIVKPVVTGSLEYNASPQSPNITPNANYTISGNVGIDSNLYTAIISLNNTDEIKNFKWLGAEEGKELDDITLDWTIMPTTLSMSPQTGVYQYALGQKLSDLEITEKAIGIGGVEVSGTFDWVDGDFKPTSNTSVQIYFSSMDTNYYNAHFYISISVIQIGITFYSNGGTAVPFTAGEHGAEISQPANPTRSHHTFDGWFKDEELTDLVEWPHILTGNINFYAKWSPVDYTATFSTDPVRGTGAVRSAASEEINLDSQTKPYNDYFSFNLNEEPFSDLFEKSTGKKITGLQVNGTGTIYNSSTPILVTGDLMLTFVFASVGDKITIDYNGGVDKGTGKAIPNADFIGIKTSVSLEDAQKEYYTLKGYATQNVAWDHEELGAAITLYPLSHFDSLTVQTGVVTYYAIWEPVTINFVYNANGGSGEAAGGLSARLNTTNFSLATIGSLTRIGYTFNGWAKTVDSEVVHSGGASINLNSEFLASGYQLSAYETGDTSITVTLFANWTRNQTTVNFNFGAGVGAPLSKIFYSGDEISVGELYPDNATYISYEFKGWSETPGGTVLVGTWTVPLTETTLYAIWELITIDVTFNAGDGSLNGIDEILQVSIESQFTLPTVDKFIANEENYIIAYFIANIAIGDKLVGYQFKPGETIDNIGLENITFTAYYEEDENPYGRGVYHTMYFGEYPKTYVGDELNAELESAYNGGALQSGMVETGRIFTSNSTTGYTGDYTPKDSIEYEYNDEKYVRHQSVRNGSYRYADNSVVPYDGNWRWFKVEPIRWIILNWDKLPTHINPDGDGTATKYELIAEQSLIAGIPFYPNASDSGRTLWKNSTIRTYLNTTFISQAFNSQESARILTSTIPNTSSSGTGYDSETGAGASYNTNDKLYIPSYYEVGNASSPYNWLFKNDIARRDVPTDYILSTNGALDTGTSGNTKIRRGTDKWFLRSANNTTNVRMVAHNGSANAIGQAVNSLNHAIRPIMSISFYHMMEFGEYPKTYVGNSLNTELETAYNNGTLKNGMVETGKVYTTNYRTGSTGTYSPKDSIEYEYNGERFVRVKSIVYEAGYIYQFGDAVGSTGDFRWFKVEPIRWIILNWDKLPTHINPDGDGTATKYELIAEQSVVGGIPFYTNASDTGRTMWENSMPRVYLRNTFMNQAFTPEESSSILTTTISNSANNGSGYNSEMGGGENYNTDDKLYLLSYYEVFNESSPYNWFFKDNIARRDAPTDFAISNNAFIDSSASNSVREASGVYWIRSAYSQTFAYTVTQNGAGYNVANVLYRTLRPAMCVAIPPAV